MQNTDSTESGKRSRTSRAREKKAGSSGTLLATGAFLIVVCVVLYSIYSTHRNSDKTLEAGGKAANEQSAANGADAPQDAGGNGGANAGGNPDAPVSSDGSDAGSGAGSGGAANAGGGVSGSDGSAGAGSAGSDGSADDGSSAADGDGGAATDTPEAPPASDKPADQGAASGSGSGEAPASPPKHTAANGGTKTDATGSTGTKLPASYVVKKGDTLSTISMKFYHSKQYVAFLAERNGIVFVNDMKPGDTIKIPALPAGAGSNAGKPDAEDYSKINLPATYLVRPGDTLYRISVQFYKSGSYASFLAKQNNLDENEGLKAGMSLTIPKKPASK
ncbi:LysM peptidoglycan-binding domain-containing protein [Paenibacillus sp. GCM10023250]|uniref:LysM peptidoglycan-binding domain-containing protein n=1 Tax=Paenibacillus sp. GCM10023250 TaxID=3252648 RepID=UPI00360E11EB